jgi:hypothetical protein
VILAEERPGCVAGLFYWLLQMQSANGAGVKKAPVETGAFYKSDLIRIKEPGCWKLACLWGLA